MSEGCNLILFPTLNEEEALKTLRDDIPEGYDVLVVDSFSEDGTRSAAKANGWKFMHASYGRGQGSGLRTGMKYFLENGYGRLYLMDADYTDNPKDAPLLGEVLQSKEADVVLGIRDFEKQKQMLGATTILTKKVVSACIKASMGWDIRDVNTGYWAFTRKSAEKILPHLSENGFTWNFEYLYVCYTLGLRVREVDVDFRKRKGATKLTLSERIRLVFEGIRYAAKTVIFRIRYRIF